MTEETKQSIEYVIGKLGDAVEALGGPASHVYEVLVKQSVVEGVQGLVVAAIFLAVLASCVKAGRYGWDLAMEEGRDSGFGVLVVSVILGIVSLIVATTRLYDAIPLLFNPEFYAIKFLMDRML